MIDEPSAANNVLERAIREAKPGAETIITVAGRPGLVTGDMLKPGAVVIDVGINVVDGRLVGDVDFESAREVAGAITPVPGGVGPMTIAMLLVNTVELASRAR